MGAVLTWRVPTRVRSAGPPRRVSETSTLVTLVAALTPQVAVVPAPTADLDVAITAYWSRRRSASTW